MPEVHRVGVVLVAERKVAEHFEVGQMAGVADEIDIVSAQTRLKCGEASTVALAESLFVWLHATTDEECTGVVVGRDQVAVDSEYDAVLLKALLHDIDYARCMVISLSSLCVELMCGTSYHARLV